MNSEKYEPLPNTVRSRALQTQSEFNRYLRRDFDFRVPRTALERIRLAPGHDALLDSFRAFFQPDTDSETIQRVAQHDEDVQDVLKQYFFSEHGKERILRIVECVSEFIGLLEDRGPVGEKTLTQCKELSRRLNDEITELEEMLAEYSDEFEPITSEVRDRQLKLHLDQVKNELALLPDQGEKFAKMWFAYFFYQTIVKENPESVAGAMIHTIKSDQFWKSDDTEPFEKKRQSLVSNLISRIKTSRDKS